MEFSLGAEGGWHVHFMPPRRLVNSAPLCSLRVSFYVFPLILPLTPLLHIIAPH